MASKLATLTLVILVAFLWAISGGWWLIDLLA